LAFDRDGALKKAEKLLRGGKVDQAIAEYVRIVEENPRDWSTANTLGELYAKSGKTEQAVEQYARVADHFVADGFYPKAAALYKKILKLTPQDESIQLQLADLSAKQGLLADAKSHLNAIGARRKAKGDRRGTAEIVIKLGSIDPADFDARIAAARTLEEMGEDGQAGERFKSLHDDLLEKGRTADAVAMLKEFARLNPGDGAARATLARAALERGDVEAAQEYLDEASAGTDPSLLLPLIDIELRSSALERARGLMRRLLETDPSRRLAVVELSHVYVDANPAIALVCVETVVDSAVASAEYQEAATRLQEFVERVPGQIPALLKLIEVCLEGGLETAMYEAQEKLTDAYLAKNQATEARVIAEDLVAREPWEPAHIDRFRRALVMLRVHDPDTLIAERLSGQAPFMAHDPFFTPPEPEPPPAPPPAPEPEPVQAAVEEAKPEAKAPASPYQAGTSSVEARASSADPIAVDSDKIRTIRIKPGTPPPAPTSSSGDEIDLTSALGDLHNQAPAEPAAPQKNLDEVFTNIRQEATSNPEFAAQHLTLAKTYMEIGMLDEAQSSLETALRSPNLRFEASAALGRLHERKGDSAKAIEWLERAAGAPAPTIDDGRSLLYDLGVMLETAGENSRALAVYLELQADAGDYRDVPSRIGRLARVQTGG
jgi:tetratricopeptide (TPR) repeat protein